MAGLCSFNLTIGFFSEPTSSTLENNRKIIGKYGAFYDQFLVHKNLRNCIFKHVGTFISNKNQTIKTERYDLMFKENKIDFYAVPRLLQASEVWLDYYNIEMSKVISTTTYRTGQLLHKPKASDEPDIASFLIENINLVIYIFICHLLTIIIVFILSKYLKIKIKDYYDLLVLNPAVLINKASKIYYRPILLAHCVFLFLTFNILNNMIKTDSVLLDTSDFIDSIYKFNKTHQKLVPLLDEASFLTNKNNRFLFQLYQRKKRLKELIDKDFLKKKKMKFKDMMKMIDSNSNGFFYFLHRNVFILTMNIFSKHMKDKIMFLNPTNYLDLNIVNIYRKNLEPKIKKIISQRIDFSFEMGFYSNFWDRFYEPDLINLKKRKFRFYEDLNSCIDDYTFITNINLDKFRTIFSCYFSILGLLLILSCLSRILHRNYKAVYLYVKNNLIKRNLFIRHRSK